MLACRACGVAHNPLLRCNAPRVTGVVTQLGTVTPLVTTGDVTKVTPVVTRTVEDMLAAMGGLKKKSCPLCVAKDAEILRLSALISGVEKPKSKGKRDRAEYMRVYRKNRRAVASGKAELIR